MICASDRGAKVSYETDGKIDLFLAVVDCDWDDKGAAVVAVEAIIDSSSNRDSLTSNKIGPESSIQQFCYSLQMRILETTSISNCSVSVDVIYMIYDMK